MTTYMNENHRKNFLPTLRPKEDIVEAPKTPINGKGMTVPYTERPHNLAMDVSMPREAGVCPGGRYTLETAESVPG